MTRDEAIAVVRAITESNSSERYIVDFVDSLEALGVVKFELVKDSTFKAAGEFLKDKFVVVNTDSRQVQARLTLDGAYEVLDILRKSGFKITKEVAHDWPPPVSSRVS